MNSESLSSDKDEANQDPEKSTISEQIENYEVGDIVWAKIGKYPYWPSIVCIEPISNIYLKESAKDKSKSMLHVRFCNDNGRRCWTKFIEGYSGKEDLLSKHPKCLSFIKNSKKQIDAWNLAIEEADGWLQIKKEERMTKYFDVNNISSVLTPSNSKGTTDVGYDANSSVSNMSKCHGYLSDRCLKTEKDVGKKRKNVFKRKNEVNKRFKRNHSFHTLLSSEDESSYDDSEYNHIPQVPTHPHRKVPRYIKLYVKEFERR